MQRKWILLTGILLLALLAVGGYYMYQKPRSGVTNVKADYSVTASELYNEFVANESAANIKYLNKVIEVSGKVMEVKKEESAMSVQLNGSDAGGVNCSLQKVPAKAPPVGSIVKVKGKCTGFLMDVNLVDAIIIK
jgi:hypothetical protein